MIFNNIFVVLPGKEQFLSKKKWLIEGNYKKKWLSCMPEYNIYIRTEKKLDKYGFYLDKYFNKYILSFVYNLSYSKNRL